MLSKAIEFSVVSAQTVTVTDDGLTVDLRAWAHSICSVDMVPAPPAWNFHRAQQLEVYRGWRGNSLDGLG